MRPSIFLTSYEIKVNYFKLGNSFLAPGILKYKEQSNLEMELVLIHKSRFQ